jgi:hypothetical protein
MNCSFIQPIFFGDCIKNSKVRALSKSARILVIDDYETILETSAFWAFKLPFGAARYVGDLKSEFGILKSIDRST